MLVRDHGLRAAAWLQHQLLLLLLHNTSAPKCSSKAARENIVCLVLLHLREIYACPLQSLSKSGFKPGEWHSHFYYLAHLGLLSALPELIPCSACSVLASPPTLSCSLGLLPSTCFKQLDFRCWEKIKRAALEGTFARSELSEVLQRPPDTETVSGSWEQA